MFALLLWSMPIMVLIALASRAHRSSDASVEPWARERGLRIDSTNRAMVAWYVRTSRTLRLLGVLAGIVLAPLAVWATDADGLGLAALLTAAIAGHLVGVAYAEVALRRPSTGSASLRPRVLSDYLNPRAQQAQRRTAAFAAVVAVAAVAVPMPESPLVSTSTRVTVLAAAPVVLVSVEALQRWLIRRPQPVVSHALLLADDAIRRHSVHSVAGAALGLLWVLAGLAMWTLAVSDVQILRWTMWIGALAAWGTAIGSVTLYDHGVWQQRRAPEARPC